MSEKLCIFCENFVWENIREGCPTCGGMDGGASCRGGMFWEEQPYDEDGWRRLILRAKDCPEYLPPAQSKREV